jgi:thiol-disulfide isomerase/thioredoxin
MSRQFMLGILFFACCARLFGQAPEGNPTELTADQKEFIALVEEFDKAQAEFWGQYEKIKDRAEQEKLFLEKEPTIEFAPKFEALEKKHHGTHLGLMIARRLTLMGVGGGVPDNPRDLTRRRMLATLEDYAGFEEFPEILRYFDAGNPETAIEGCLRTIIGSSKATEQNRLFAKLMLARWTIQMRDTREFIERRMEELKSGEKEQYPKEGDGLATRLKPLLPREQTAKLEQEALETLRMLSKTDAAFQQPAVKGVDDRWMILCVDRDANKARPTIKDLADGLLFKEEHLRPGKPAPELELSLTSGKSWSLADQKGKCVIIQFSFKGCGPCEQMYPTLRELAKQFPEQLSIVSIMADQTREETVEAVESGKMTWGAHFDGQRGPICTKWAVRGFPTVYVVDREGNVVEDVGRGDRMMARIAELCR